MAVRYDETLLMMYRAFRVTLMWTINVAPLKNTWMLKMLMLIVAFFLKYTTKEMPITNIGDNSSSHNPSKMQNFTVLLEIIRGIFLYSEPYCATTIASASLWFFFTSNPVLILHVLRNSIYSFQFEMQNKLNDVIQHYTNDN